MTYHDPSRSGLGAFPPSVGGEMDIDPRSHGTSVEGGRLVPTVWAQRSLNAAGIRTIVDGLAGQGTLANLRAYWGRLSSTRGPEPALQSGHPDWVFISSAMEGNFSLLRRVPDPSGSTVAASSWTTPTSQPRRTTTGTSTTDTSSDGGGSPKVSPDTLLPTPPVSSMDWTPWVVGGSLAVAGLIGVGLIASRRKPQKNRRRR
jgi:hypothetical protein